MKSRKRREDEVRKARKKFVISMTIALVVLTILVVYMIVNMPTGYYRGRYSSLLKELFEKLVNDEEWSNESNYHIYLREIFYEYYIKLYNTSFIFNYTFLLRPGQESVVYRVFLGANETLYVETYGNDTYYYTISLDIHGKINILGYALLGNSSRSIAISDVIELTLERRNATLRTVLYNESYLIIFTNISRPVSGYVFVNKTPPVNLTSILRVVPIEYTVWLFQNWIRDRYTILTRERVSIDDMIRNVKPPWDILSKDTRDITILEACILLHRLYSIVGIENRILAIDLDGDSELDHFAIAIKYAKTPSDYVRIMTDYILNDANINIIDREVNVKYATALEANWIIVDPVYEYKYVPAFINLKYYYNLGIVR